MLLESIGDITITFAVEVASAGLDFEAKSSFSRSEVSINSSTVKTGIFHRAASTLEMVVRPLSVGPWMMMQRLVSGEISDRAAVESRAICDGSSGFECGGGEMTKI